MSEAKPTELLPERIWLRRNPESLRFGVSAVWSPEREDESDIEYTRTPSPAQPARVGPLAESFDLNASIAEIIGHSPAQAEWLPIETMPKDGTPILRPHSIWGAMNVKYKPCTRDGFNLDWMSADYSIAWPENAFLPYWMPLPQPPKGDDKQ